MNDKISIALFTVSPYPGWNRISIFPYQINGSFISDILNIAAHIE
ncbi:hypothetical protein EC12741_B0185 [Escherichia coli 1.2741]|nr:hypothetical protein EC12741_B0185 [Escherichia coli 1.2741]